MQEAGVSKKVAVGFDKTDPTDFIVDQGHTPEEFRALVDGARGALSIDTETVPTNRDPDALPEDERLRAQGLDAYFREGDYGKGAEFFEQLHSYGGYGVLRHFNEVSRKIKEALPKTTMIFGGLWYSARPTETLQNNPAVDYETGYPSGN